MRQRSPSRPPELAALSPWRVRALLGLAAGVFIGTLLAVFAARSRAELAGWWTAGMTLALLSWGGIALSSWLGWKLSLPLRNGPRWLVFFALFWGGIGVMLIFGLLLPFSPLGLVLSALPFVVGVALYWCRAGRAGVADGVVGGVVLFLICMRLFTLPPERGGDPYEFAQATDTDVWVMSWNIGRGAPFFGAAAKSSAAHVAKTITEQGADVVCLQEVPSRAYLDEVLAGLDRKWRGELAKGDGAGAAVLSRVGGVFESPTGEFENGAPMLLRITSNKGILQFVSCHAPAGRRASGRRAIVDWVLNRVRDPRHKTVVAGDFNIDPERRWCFLTPLLTDAPGFDRATWTALSILGPDPGLGGDATSSLGRRLDWVVVDSKMEIADYRVLGAARKGRMDHRPVLVRVGLGKTGRSAASAVAGSREAGDP